jgi:Family of unknown function (DUF6084)
MVELDLCIEGVKVERYSAAPLLLFALQVTKKTPDVPVFHVMLNCQVRIEPTRRSYSSEDHERLSDLFGEPPRWGQTLHSFLWTHASVSVPAFEHNRRVDLPVPCSYDFNVAATKYFHGLGEGEVPLNFLFSGSVFYRDSAGRMQIGQIAWDKESAFRLPVAVWREMMERYYPQSTWLCLGRDVFEQLYRYKRQKGLASFDEALAHLIETTTVDAIP